MTEAEIKSAIAAILRESSDTSPAQDAAIAPLITNFLINQQRIADALTKLALCTEHGHAFRIDNLGN